MAQVGIGAISILLPACIGGLSSCNKNQNNPAPTPVDFNLDVSNGPLATKGGFILNANVIVARTLTDTFIAVSSTCTHQGSTINYSSKSNVFICPNHGAIYDSNGNVMQGPAAASLTKYNTTLTGTNLHVFS